MAKPVEGFPGNSGHIHVSITSCEGKNLFARETKDEAAPWSDIRFVEGRLLAGLSETTGPPPSSHATGTAAWLPDIEPFQGLNRLQCPRGPPDWQSLNIGIPILKFRNAQSGTESIREKSEHALISIGQPFCISKLVADSRSLE